MKPQIEQPVDCKIESRVIKYTMSSEQVTNKNSQQFIIDGEDLSLDIDHDIKKKKNVKVDINVLMDKVREEKKKEKKENLIFVSLIASLLNRLK